MKINLFRSVFFESVYFFAFFFFKMRIKKLSWLLPFAVQGVTSDKRTIMNEIEPLQIGPNV